jgi:hypothetical protein
MLRRPLTFAIVLVAGVALAACSSSGSSSKSSSGASSTVTTATTAKPTTTTPEATTTTAAVTTTTAAKEPNGAASPEDAAQGLYGRWVAGDAAGARSFARDSAIGPLFARPGAGAHWTFQSCDGVAGGAYCLFSFEGGGASMHVVDMSIVGDGSVTGFKVDEIQYTAD